jgi:uncharacterized protein YecT (DUF1311 family)
VFIVAVVVIFCLPTVTALADACEGLPSRLAMECEAFAELTVAEEEMTQAYDALWARMQTTEAKQHLTDAQTAWSAYREKSCAFQSVVWLRGSGTSARVMFCKAEHAKRRAAELQVLLSCRSDDCPH